MAVAGQSTGFPAVSRPARAAHTAEASVACFIPGETTLWLCWILVSVGGQRERLPAWSRVQASWGLPPSDLSPAYHGDVWWAAAPGAGARTGYVVMPARGEPSTQVLMGSLAWSWDPA